MTVTWSGGHITSSGANSTGIQADNRGNGNASIDASGDISGRVGSSSGFTFLGLDAVAGDTPSGLPTPSSHCKSGPVWVHEIKHDGYRLIARRTGGRVKLYTRRGYIWTDRYPCIVDALLSLRVRSITIDGEAVVCGVDGKSDFDKLHSRAHDAPCTPST